MAVLCVLLPSVGIRRSLFPVWIIGGFLHSLYANASGFLFASGNGLSGQLGNGAAANRNLPLFVTGAIGTISAAGGGYHSVFLTAPRIIMASLTINPTGVMAGSSATGTVTLTDVAGPGGLRVILNWTNSSAATMPSYVDVPEGSRTATFSISTNRVLGSRTVVTVYANMINQVSATLTIDPWFFQQR